MADKQPSVAPGPAPSEASHVQQDRLNRSLSARQVQMIAIGGTIGTGLFLGTGSSLATGGPASMLIAYAISGGIVFVTMLSLGEMAAFVPVAGSFCTFAGCAILYYSLLPFVTNSVQEIRRRRIWVRSNLELLVQRCCFHRCGSGRTAAGPPVLVRQLSWMGFQLDLLGCFDRAEFVCGACLWRGTFLFSTPEYMLIA